MTQTITHIAVDPVHYTALQAAAARYFRESFNASTCFMEAFLVTEQVKDAGLVELYNELSEDLKTIPQ